MKTQTLSRLVILDDLERWWFIFVGMVDDLFRKFAGGLCVEIGGGDIEIFAVSLDSFSSTRVQYAPMFLKF